MFSYDGHTMDARLHLSTELVPVNRGGVVSRELQGSPGLHDYNLFNHSSLASQVGPRPSRFDEQSDNIKQDVMSTQKPGDHSEAFYLYFIATVGIALNIVVILAIVLRQPLRKMTSGFLIHACLLDLIKSAYCIPLATNLLSATKPGTCDFFGASFVIIVTTSVFNMVAMVCTEAYTFGEKNIGGNSKGTVICVMFGIILVYIGSMILHLGPTLIGGRFEYNPDIGSCMFSLGKQTGYVAHVMWVIISTVAMIAVFHFIYRLYREIQINRPNRVSFLVRTSITVMDSATSSTCRLRKIIRDATHRAKIFLYNAIFYIVCWYPYFFLVILDKSFTLSPKVYQAFAFIAWSQGPLQPIIYIFFDRNLNILAKHMYCDKYRYDIDTIIQMMMNRHRNSDHGETRSPDAEGSCSSTEAQNDLDTRSHTPPINSMHEHRNICLVQNTPNHNFHPTRANITPNMAPNMATNISPHFETVDLTHLSPCSNLPPAVVAEEMPSPPMTPVSFQSSRSYSRSRSRTPTGQNYENLVRDPTYMQQDEELTEVEF